jgi:hypothetical protein
MSAGPDPRSSAQVIEQERRRLSQRLDEVARLCEGTLPPGSFYGELLQRLIESLAAVAGSVWVRTPQGNLQQQFQVNMQQAGLDGDEARAQHDALLRVAFMQPQPMSLPPRSTMGAAEEGKTTPGNPTPFLLLLVPIRQNEQTIGLIEVLQGPNRPAAAIPGFLQYMAMMADLAARYQRNQLVGQLVGQQQLWVQLEGFARQVHSSLNPLEVSFHVANEGRRLIECDRVSVATRRGGRRTEVEAVSGCDVVEKRSNQVRLLRKLCDAVLDWGERLTYSGTKDDSLPPRVLEGLDAYLAESPSKLLVIQPLRDEREGDGKDKPRLPPRSALVMECFESPGDTAQIMARLDVVSRHATTALYNSIEHRRIPFRFVWMPLAKAQEGLGGKTRAIVLAIVAGLSLIAGALIFLPYPLKVEASGNAYPVVRRVVYSPVVGTIKHFDAQPNEEVPERRSLVRMFDATLYQKIKALQSDIKSAEMEANELTRSAERETQQAEKTSKQGRAALRRVDQRTKQDELDELMERTHSVRGQPGWFLLQAPVMSSEERRVVDRSVWTVLTSNFGTSNFNFRERENAEVKPSEPILRLGAKDGPWELELKIPQKHIGQVLRAFERQGRDKPLDVDFILLGRTTILYKGKLEYGRIAGEATPDQEQQTGENEPTVLAYVRIEGKDIPAGYEIPRVRLLTSSGVRAKINCGDYRAGYSLFYGVWEFLYEKVVFWFF